MLVTYTIVGRSLWGGHIPGEASDHYHSQINAKRKVTPFLFFLLLSLTTNPLSWPDLNRKKQQQLLRLICLLIFHRWWRWWLWWWWRLPYAGCPTMSTSYWDHLTETFISNITFSRFTDASLFYILESVVLCLLIIFCLHQVYLAIFWLAMSSTMYNPIIYCCLNQRWSGSNCAEFKNNIIASKMSVNRT